MLLLRRAIAILLLLVAAPATAAEPWPTLTPSEPTAPPADGSTVGTTARELGRALIRFYQVAISPLDGPTCRFQPTCSAYGAQAIVRHGLLKGILLTADRLERCNPYNTMAGYPTSPEGRLVDPVP